MAQIPTTRVLRDTLAQIGIILAVLGTSAGPAEVESQESLQEWSATLEWDVGDWDGPTSFTQISALLPDPRGGVFVTQPEYSEIWRFGGDGVRSQVIGRKGQGPGEFQDPVSLFWHGDSLAVWDIRLSRLSLFSPDGSFVRSFPTPVMSMGIGLLQDGSTLSTKGGVLSRDLVSGRVTQTPLRKLSPDQSGFDTIAVLSIDHHTTAVRNGDAVLYGQQPFSDNPLWRVSPNGRLAVLIDRDSERTEGRGSFLITVLDGHGRETVQREIPFRPIRLDDRTVWSMAEREARVVREWHESIGLPAGMFGPEHFRDAYFIPRYHPPVEDIAVEPNGTIWLRRESRADKEEVVWLVLDEGASPMAEIRLPKELEIIAPTGELLFGAARDEMSVFHLRCYRLRRDGDGRRQWGQSDPHRSDQAHGLR